LAPDNLIEITFPELTALAEVAPAGISDLSSEDGITAITKVASVRTLYTYVDSKEMLSADEALFVFLHQLRSGTVSYHPSMDGPLFDPAAYWLAGIISYSLSGGPVDAVQLALLDGHHLQALTSGEDDRQYSRAILTTDIVDNG
jgi:hypothetical protein